MKGTARVIIFTGEGKGKTTAALGIGVAAAAQGQQVVMVQFLKGGGYTGELFAQAFLAPKLTVRQFGFGCPIAAAIKSGEASCQKCGQCFRQNRDPALAYGRQAFDFAEAVLQNGEADILILDEVSHAIRHGLLPLEKITGMIAARPPHVTIILTGRYMPRALLALSDQATELVAVKHPIDAGIDARRGSEY